MSEPMKSAAAAGQAETFSGEWENFRAGLLAGAEPILCAEMQRAFYCGAFSLFMMLDAIGDVGDDEAIARTDAVFTELEEFLDSRRYIADMEPVAEVEAMQQPSEEASGGRAR